VRLAIGISKSWPQFEREMQQLNLFARGTKEAATESLNTKRLEERKMKRARRRARPKGDINITPFIDILLVLLVIFMTITPLTPKGLNTTIPQPPPPNTHSDPENAVVLSMDGNGVIRLNQDELAPSRLIERLQEIFRTRNDRTLFVQGDGKLLFGDIAQLIDSANGAGVERVGIITDQISGSHPR
jgi:biopolymer transport protein TolR